MRMAGLVCGAAMALVSTVLAQEVTKVTATLPETITPEWTRGIQPIGQDSYWNAVACGKQGGANPPCVFWDTLLCKNPEFTLAMYTPYKSVAYEVWGAVRAKQPAPTPNYQAAQRLRVIIGVTPAKGSKNAVSAVTITRSGKTVAPMTRLLKGAGGDYTFDFSVFAPTADIALELTGKTASVSCAIPKDVLARLR